MIRLRFGVAGAVLALAGCRPPVAQSAPALAPKAKPASPRVLDALDASDRDWAYIDGAHFRESVLPDLLEAAGSLRVDVRVGLAELTKECGFEPLLSVDELLGKVRWDQSEHTAAWTAVLRLESPLEQSVKCLRAIAPEAQETALDGHRAWQLRRAFATWDDGLFVVANNAVEARAVMARMAHPDAASEGTRATLQSIVLAANLARPDPYGLDALGVRWVPEPVGSRVDVESNFAAEENAKHAETIAKDSLLQLLGSSASLDPAVSGVAQRFVDGVVLNRDGAKLHAVLEMPKLAGETAFVTQLASLATKGTRLYRAWDRMGEARDTVYVIAHALVTYVAETQKLGRSARFPPSAPLVPDDIPYGRPVVPNPHAFSYPSWQDIHYSSDRPTFYAYDFVTAKDGKSVVVQGRGDIDGDGTTSLFELDVHLDAKGVPTIAPLIRERDPEE